jgi:hypothetical protein
MELEQINEFFDCDWGCGCGYRDHEPCGKCYFCNRVELEGEVDRLDKWRRQLSRDVDTYIANINLLLEERQDLIEELRFFHEEGLVCSEDCALRPEIEKLREEKTNEVQ